MAPRTGCTALAQVLKDHLSGEYFPRESVLDEHGFFKVQNKHGTLGQLLANGLLTPSERAALFAFTTVRNPFDSLVSSYTKKATKYQPLLANPKSWVYQYKGYVKDMECCRTHDFNEWIRMHYRQNTLNRLRGVGRRRLYSQWTDGVDFVMRFERLQADFDAALQQAGLGRRFEIPVINVTGRDRDYRSYYTRASRRIVEYAFADELAKFGYRF